MKIEPVAGETSFFKFSGREGEGMLATGPNLTRKPHLITRPSGGYSTFMEEADAWQLTMLPHKEFDFEIGRVWRRGGMRDFVFDRDTILEAGITKEGAIEYQVTGWKGKDMPEVPLRDYLMMELMLRKLGVLK